MQGKVLCKRVTEICAPKAEEIGVYIWDVEFEKEGSIYCLTIYLDAETGINIEHCEQMSRFIDPILDDSEFDSLPSYTLCVSSAGAERKLTKDMHYKYALGKKVLVKFYKALDGAKTIEDTLNAYDENSITIGDKTFDTKDISSVRLTIEF